MDKIRINGDNGWSEEEGVKIGECFAVVAWGDGDCSITHISTGLRIGPLCREALALVYITTQLGRLNVWNSSSAAELQGNKPLRELMVNVTRSYSDTNKIKLLIDKYITLGDSVYSMVSAAVPKIEKKEVESANVCTCEVMTLMRIGCQCGG